MKVILENGIVLETQVSDPSGGENYPLTKAQILKKAENLIKICYPGKEKQIAENCWIWQRQRDYLNYKTYQEV